MVLLSMPRLTRYATVAWMQLTDPVSNVRRLSSPCTAACRLPAIVENSCTVFNGQKSVCMHAECTAPQHDKHHHHNLQQKLQQVADLKFDLGGVCIGKRMYCSWLSSQRGAEDVPMHIHQLLKPLHAWPQLPVYAVHK